MDLIPNSGLDPIPDGLRVELEGFRDLHHGQELVIHGTLSLIEPTVRAGREPGALTDALQWRIRNREEGTVCPVQRLAAKPEADMRVGALFAESGAYVEECKITGLPTCSS
jgi:hypothetical protein